MAIKYTCRYCGTGVGEITDDSVTEYRLGFHFLTPDERRDIISYDSTGNVTVKVICDYCKEAVDSNPELLLFESPLQ